MININLLPRKEFEILCDGKVIPGKFGTWSAKRFSDLKKLTLKQLGTYLDKELTLSDVILNILCAVEYACRKRGEKFEYTDMNVSEWIDEMGGVHSDMFLELCGHAKSELAEVEDEKKNSLNGTSSNEQATALG